MDLLTVMTTVRDLANMDVDGLNEFLKKKGLPALVTAANIADIKRLPSDLLKPGADVSYALPIFEKAKDYYDVARSLSKKGTSQNSKNNDDAHFYCSVCGNDLSEPGSRVHFSELGSS